MSSVRTNEKRPHKTRSRSALVVLGMHRSGSSVITGALELCGAWVGEKAELTGANLENPRGFWERRDIRTICDRLLHAAGADWWKVARFEPNAIPHAVLAEERKKFTKVISSLDEHGTWVLKEPRLCLLLPLLGDCITDSACIHIFRNPLEVARSLQARNGFAIASGLALWEAYNRHALSASQHLPRLLVSHESLMRHPVETLSGLLEQLVQLTGIALVKPEDARIRQFVEPSLYRRRVEDKETHEYLSPSQIHLWEQFCSGRIFENDSGASNSRVTGQHLSDLESTEHSIEYHKTRTSEVAHVLSARTRLVAELRRQLTELNGELNRRKKTIKTHEATISSHQTAMKAHKATIKAHEVAIKDHQTTIKRHQTTIKAQESTIRTREATIRDLLASPSWKVTTPLRFCSRVLRRIVRNLRRLPFPGKRADTTRAPSHIRASDSLDRVSPYNPRQRLKAAEAAFWNDDLEDTLAHLQQLNLLSYENEAVSGHAKLLSNLTHCLSDLDKYKAEVESYLAAGAAQPARRFVIYTAMSGNCDSIRLPVTLSHAFDHILFTDSAVPDTGIWRIRPITYFGSDKTRSARFVKTHPHTLLGEYDVAIWIDSNVMILHDVEPIIKEFLSSGRALAAIPHPLRQSIYEEVIACIERKKDDKHLMQQQMDKYKKEAFSHCDLIESNFMIFDLRHEKLSSFLECWWREIDLHSRRDQLSLNYALHRSALDWHPLTERPDSIRNHRDFAFVPHDQGHGPSLKLVEALECETFDPYDGHSYSEVKDKRIASQRCRRIDIVVCVHNALEDVSRCLESVMNTRRGNQHKVILVDDGSEYATAKYLDSMATAGVNCELYRNSSAQGYTKAANLGLSISSGELVVLLNSDTIVTENWLEKLSDAVFSTPGAGIVGPLSNAASYQSIPEYQGSRGQTAINTLPANLGPADINEYCEKWTVEHILPIVPLVHGFCFGITRPVIERIGLFDDKNYPQAYGEENDYCFRATEAGFLLVVATHTFIYHVKSRSYSEEQRRPLAKAASQRLKETYGHYRVDRAQLSMAHNPILAKFRSHAREVFESKSGSWELEAKEHLATARN